MQVPAERLVEERELLRPLTLLRPALRGAERWRVDRRGTVRFGLARHLVPKTLVGARVKVLASTGKIIVLHAGAEVIRYDPVGPGEVAFGNLATTDRRPTRGIRPRTAVEVAFIGLSPVAETFLRSASRLAALRCFSNLHTDSGPNDARSANSICVTPARFRASRKPGSNAVITWARITSEPLFRDAHDVRAELHS